MSCEARTDLHWPRCSAAGAVQRAEYLIQRGPYVLEHPAELGHVLAQAGEPLAQDTIAVGRHRHLNRVQVAQQEREFLAQPCPRFAHRLAERLLERLGTNVESPKGCEP